MDKKNCKRDIFVVKKIPRRQLWKLCKRRNKKKILRRRLWKLCKRRKKKKKLQGRKKIQRDCCENFARVEDWRNKTKGATVKSLQEKKKKKKIQGDCKKYCKRFFWWSKIQKQNQEHYRWKKEEERRSRKMLHQSINPWPQRARQPKTPILILPSAQLIWQVQRESNPSLPPSCSKSCFSWQICQSTTLSLPPSLCVPSLQLAFSLSYFPTTLHEPFFFIGNLPISALVLFHHVYSSLDCFPTPSWASHRYKSANLSFFLLFPSLQLWFQNNCWSFSWQSVSLSCYSISTALISEQQLQELFMAICQSLLLFHLYSSDFRTTARAFHGNLSISFLFHLYSSDFACSIIILEELLWQLVFVQSSFDGFALDVFVWFFFVAHALL